MERVASQVEALYTIGPQGVAALASASRRCRDAANASEGPWWFFLGVDFLITAAPGARAEAGVSARELYVLARRCKIRPISPWHAPQADDLRSIADTVRSAAAGLRELKKLPPVTHLDDDDWYVGDDEVPVEPLVFTESVRFDPGSLASVLSLWERGDEAGLRELPGEELVSDSAALEGDSAETLVRIALSVSFCRTTSRFVPDPDSEVEFDPLALPGEGRLLALNLASPDDDHCAIYLAHGDFCIRGRWVWNSDGWKLNPGFCSQVPRRIFQTRGQPEGPFRRFLAAAAKGLPIRVLVISTGVGAACRDVSSSSGEDADEGEERITAKLLDEVLAQPFGEETLFGLPMDRPRPWPDLGSAPASNRQGA